MKYTIAFPYPSSDVITLEPGLTPVVTDAGLLKIMKDIGRGSQLVAAYSPGAWSWTKVEEG